MKKHLFILGLALALFNVGCDDQNTIPNGYVQTTQKGASTLVLKGYENAALGFSVFQPEGFDSPFSQHQHEPTPLCLLLHIASATS